MIPNKFDKDVIKHLKDFLSTDQVAKKLNISSRQICNLCNQGYLGKKLNGRWLITKNELRRFVKSGRPRVGRPKNDR